MLRIWLESRAPAAASEELLSATELIKPEQPFSRPDNSKTAAGLLHFLKHAAIYLSLWDGRSGVRSVMRQDPRMVTAP